MSNLETNQGLICGYYGALTIDNTVGGVGFPAGAIAHASIIGRVRKIYGVLETGQVRFTVDGSTAPTLTVGILLEVGQNITLYDEEARDFKAIRTGASGSLKYQVWYELL